MTYNPAPTSRKAQTLNSDVTSSLPARRRPRVVSAVVYAERVSGLPRGSQRRNHREEHAAHGRQRRARADDADVDMKCEVFGTQRVSRGQKPENKIVEDPRDDEGRRAADAPQ